MQRALLKFGLIIVIGVLCLAIWYATWAAYVDTIHPGSLGITIAEIEAKLGKSFRSKTQTLNGSTYTVTYGELKTIYLPSGPPVYIFDSSGRLVGWTPDIGDDANFRQKWGL